MQVLAPELELGQSHYRLCLYQRDLPALQYVADALVQASEASRRTLLILSDSFLKQEWSRWAAFIVFGLAAVCRETQ